MGKTEKLSFRVHPRVFDALGSELVTNDSVALTELVKNAYDAYASRVDIRFKEDQKSGKQSIEIQDNGCGMKKEIIEDVWCVVSTPYRTKIKYSGRGDNRRRVSGEKGLGRLSAARLGTQLTLITKANNDKCWKIELDWDVLRKVKDFSQCEVNLSDISEANPFDNSGTLLIIENLKKVWPKNKIEDFDVLKDHFSRFIAPDGHNEKAGRDVFEVWIKLFDQDPELIETQSSELFEKSPYLFEGTFDGKSSMEFTYIYDEGKSKRKIKNKISSMIPLRVQHGEEEKPSDFMCGPFSFKIRAWDLDVDVLTELSERLNLKKKAGSIRNLIKKHSGISLYRDSVLVLPKSRENLDWLGMDLRRVSELGSRLSTSQVIGQIFISAELNPNLIDTSNREGLTESIASKDFRDVFVGAIKHFEKYRGEDRNETRKEPPLQDLFNGLSANKLISDVSEIAVQGRPATDVVPMVEKYGNDIEKTVAIIEKRFVYYSRLATIGILAAMVMHEIRNRTVVIGTFIKNVGVYFKNLNKKADSIFTQIELVDNSIHALERMADRFAPLAVRSFGKKRRNCFVEDVITDCLEMRKQALEKKNIHVQFKNAPKHFLAVDLGDLSAVLLNLFDNSIYWLAEVDKDKRKINIRIEEIQNEQRIRIHFNDSGPGISPDYLEKVFWPGVTTRPDGLGMGLTVAAEIVDQYEGAMKAVESGPLGGAGFVFDLPMSQREGK